MTSVSAYELEIEQRIAANRLRLEELGVSIPLATLTEPRVAVRKPKQRVEQEGPRRVSERLAAKEQGSAEMEPDSNSGKDAVADQHDSGNDNKDPDYSANESEGKCGFANAHYNLGISMTSMTNDDNDY